MALAACGDDIGVPFDGGNGGTGGSAAGSGGNSGTGGDGSGGNAGTGGASTGGNISTGGSHGTGGNAGTGGSGLGGGFGIGGSGDDGGPVDQTVRLIDQFSNAACQRFADCGFMVDGGWARCESDIEATTFSVLRQARDRQWSLNANAVQGCLNWISKQACSSLRTPREEMLLCLNSFFVQGGGVSDGGHCENLRHCADPTTACMGPFCTATCQPTGALGQPCRRTAEQCDTGLFCDGVKCLAPRAAGEACSPYRANECVSSTVCFNGICTTKPAAGSMCLGGDGGTCAASAHCSGTTCVANFPAGTACTLHRECAAGLVCSQQICAPIRPEGAACKDGTEACAPGVGCDILTRTCTKPRSVSDAGAACTFDISCQLPLFCQGREINFDGGVGVLGTCIQIQVGDDCQHSLYCPTGAYCGSDAKCRSGFTDGGNPCYSSNNCVVPMECQGGICKRPPPVPPDAGPTLVASGMACSRPSDVCARSGDACRFSQKLPDGGARYACGPRGGLGASCQTQFYPERDCQYPLGCFDGGCVPVGLVGQPCPPGSSCPDSACIQADGGFSPAGLGICTKLPAGAQCRRALECASNECDFLTGVCIDVCL